MKTIIASAAVLLMTTTSSFAQDIDSVFGWGGFYAGVHGGWSKINTSDNSSGSPTSFDDDGDAFVGGLHVGYNVPITQDIWLGVEADIDGANLGGIGPCANSAFTCRTQIDWLASVRARAGVDFGRFIAFGTGGIAFTDTKHDTVPGFVGFADTANRTGFVVGAGIEMHVARNFTVGVEGLYYDFGDAGLLGGTADRVEVDVSVVRTRLSYKF